MNTTSTNYLQLKEKYIVMCRVGYFVHLNLFSTLERLVESKVHSFSTYWIVINGALGEPEQLDEYLCFIYLVKSPSSFRSYQVQCYISYCEDDCYSTGDDVKPQI